MTTPKTYTLIGPDGAPYTSTTPGTLGGITYGKNKLYGRLDCPSALSRLRNPEQAAIYAKSRVFFADEVTAIAAGFRPCGNCCREQYKAWKDIQAEPG